MARLEPLLPSLLVVWATVFNAVLAFVNAHVAAMSPATVIASEVGTVAAAHFVALRHFREDMKPWYVLLGVIFALYAARSILTYDPQVRYIRDVLIIPTFVLLGMAAQRRYLARTVCVIHAAVIAVLIYEAVDTDGFSQLFDIQGYYINTRGYDDANFWNKESELFVSAIRPQDRIFLPFLGLHRLSSLFLEPVSLGNYCVVVTAFICAFYPSLSQRERWFLGVGNLVVLIGCDGRLAAVSSLAIILVSLAGPKLPRGAALLYLPIVTLAAIAAVNLAGFRAGPDDLPGRIAHTVALLERLDIPEFMGVSDDLLWLAVDSGVVYMILTQSLIGLGLIWIFIVMGSREDRLDQTRYIHAICIYLSFAMMVSFSIFTIKTAALLWFAHGVLQRREQAGPIVSWLPQTAAWSPAGAAEDARPAE